MLLKINVTQEDIDKGIQSDSMKCPLAIAIQKELDKNNIKRIVSVNISFFMLITPDINKSDVFSNTKEMKKFVSSYDSIIQKEYFHYANKHAIIHPFNFQIEIPDER